MTEHIEELAELYAIGSVDDLERLRVERHGRTCAACASRLREATETVARLEALQGVYEPSNALRARAKASARGGAGLPLIRRWGMSLAAAAAALALVALPSWVALDRTRQLAQYGQDRRALAQLASASSVDRAVFSSVTNERVQAEVLYNPGAHWYYVVVRNPQRGMQVGCIRDGRTVVLGTVSRHGESGSLYLPRQARIEELVILEDRAPVADAHLTI